MVYERMLSYSKATSRAVDGAENHVVMNGISGYFGISVYLKYLEDGYIQLTGDNIDGENAWKLISNFTLEPGTYTLTGMNGVSDKTVALQLLISCDNGFNQYLYQYDEDVFFTLDLPSKATLHVMVYPNAVGIDVTARPAVYKDE